MNRSLLLLLSLTAATAFAVRTETITQHAYADFFSGELNNVSLSNRGALTAGPALNEVLVIDDASSIWSAVADQEGNLYIGTGKKGAVYKITPEAEQPELIFNPNSVMTRALVLDQNNHLFVATSPDGAIYRIKPGGRPEVFFDPEEMYVWDMTFDDHGNLYVATGSDAKIFQIPPDFELNDEAPVYFSSDRRNFTRLTWDADGALIAGTGPEAYLYRITGPDEGEVLYSAGTDEIANVASVGDDIYFSTWHKHGGSANPPTNQAPLLAAFFGIKPNHNKQANGGPAPDPSAAPSFLLKLDGDGFVTPIWSPGGGNLQSLVPDGEGGFLVGSDGDGRLYSVTSADDWSLLNEAERGGEITVILTDVGPSSKRYVFTSNPAAIYELTDQPAEKPTFTSEPIDARTVARWGRIHALGDPSKSNGISWKTRTGNAAEPDDTWSDWTPLDGGIVASPPARYLQYRVTFTRPGARLPGLTAYFGSRNLAPLVSRINIIPVGLNIITNLSAGPKTIGADDLVDPGKTAQALAKPPTENQKVIVENETGAVAVAWQALDPNGDDMRFSVAIQTEGSEDWITLASHLVEEAYSTPTRGFHDGYAVFRVTAEDSPSNRPSEARSGFLISPPFLIDNTSPVVKLHDQFEGSDGETILLFTATDDWGVIAAANFRLDGAEPVNAIPEDLLFDSRDEVFRLTLDHLRPGPHSIVFETTDQRGNRGLAKAVFSVE